jgi:hypothetical protein
MDDNTFLCERCAVRHPWNMLDMNYWMAGWMYACRLVPTRQGRKV